MCSAKIQNEIIAKFIGIKVKDIVTETEYFSKIATKNQTGTLRRKFSCFFFFRYYVLPQRSVLVLKKIFLDSHRIQYRPTEKVIDM